MVFDKVSPLRKVMRLGTTGKLTPRFVELFSILERVGKLAYQIEIPAKLVGVHDVFHILHLKKCLHGITTIVDYDQLVDIEMEPIAPLATTCIMEHETRKLCNKEIRLVRVQLGDNPVERIW